MYFRHLVPRLVNHIEEADAVFDCVVRLTQPDILHALRVHNAAIVVQKEDFLRLDHDVKAFHRRELRRG